MGVLATIMWIIIGLPICFFVAAESGKPWYGVGAFVGLSMCIIALATAS